MKDDNENPLRMDAIVSKNKICGCGSQSMELLDYKEYWHSRMAKAKK